MADLTDREIALLVFETAWGPTWTTGKESAALEAFALSGPRYSQELLALLDRPEALLRFGPLVNRLQRLRQRRRRDRDEQRWTVA